ncbi:hypothetical protein PGT21_028380 [Puccinia graminis f. sp. tritici]|uniref:NADH:flavin oxidoreductase/NADH oxidase N-terminal domain-containing protein n=1 Tax=Puccinia graminis f. sp. tritici TaxID=56615 RepID=A0A5B0N5H1_PUCGR|nr:hypothetical protein PGT21_028380 [Puccinia graminis f. sp. tritici]KAA1133001.1 hypothetical protein PGTUg99_020598 [Puccinia graminis f. sp. tritici]
MDSTDQQQIDVIQQPIRLPCGLELTNRLVKAAMAPCLAKAGQPTPEHHRLYNQWSQDRFGLLITENVQVCPRHLATPTDIAIRHGAEKDPIPTSWQAWAKVCGPRCLVQLSHAGLQSPRGCGRTLGDRPIGPSAMRVCLGNRLIDRLVAWALFDHAREASKDDINLIIEQFRAGALFCHRAGFQGVQLHCSHGFLLSEFLSAKTNQRHDEYGMSATNRLRILFQIIDAIRSSVPESFCLSIKLNCSDLSEGGLTQEEALDNLRRIVTRGGIDLIEISGGTYENCPTSKEEVTPQPKSKKKGVDRREAYYVEFTQEARRVLRTISTESRQPCPILMTTGGFRSRSGMAAAISNEETDLIGLGRPACLDPLLSTKILDSNLANYVSPNPPVPGVTLWKILVPVKLVGAGFKTMWHTWQLHRMSRYQPPDLACTALGSLRVILPLDALLASLAILLSLLAAGIVARLKA